MKALPPPGELALELSCKVEEVVRGGPEKREGPELLVENIEPPRSEGLKGIGMRSWGRLLKLEKSPDIIGVVIGMEDMSSDGIWEDMSEVAAAAAAAWFTLLFSSASASQKALCVMKLSLLQNLEQVCQKIKSLRVRSLTHS